MQENHATFSEYGELQERRHNMKTISTANAPAAIGPYAQGNIAGGLLFASGQIPLDPETGEIVGSTIEEQTAQVMKNVAAILEAAGTDFDHVVKTTCFLNDMNDFAAFNAEYAKSFGEVRPARSAVAVEKLPKGALVEVEVIAEVN
jgi:2-iminobutanoate/2-iminopropanoate deaminase